MQLSKPNLFFKGSALLLFGLLYFTTVLYAQEQIEHIDYNEFPPEYIQPNKILKEEIYKYNIKNNKTDSTLFKLNVYLYNANGKIIEQQKFDEKRTLKVKNTYVYNSFNKISKESNYYQREGIKRFGLQDLFYEFAYDSLGRVTYTYYYNKDTTTLKSIQKVYNNRGQLIKTFQKINKDMPLVHNLLNYDEKGLLTKLEVFDNKGDAAYSYIFEYDIAQNTKNVYTLRGNERHFEEILKYNRNDQIITRISNSKYNTPDKSDTEAQNSVEKLTYNDDGTINSDIYYINGSVTNLYKHFYQK